ncbi:hypothetical protein JYU34_018823 [Plutella xylostella]|uniref:DNA polymerase alpha subunit B n=1 Tax=Plutella xylostella TaxID=51655 RepID=A0ABQ7PZD3_PLUXY|nr:hypothetical protein JYU34_018823 [Plutella xylostella]
MATEELVTEQFQFLGIDVDNDVLTKCILLCEEYGVDAETFVEQWMAFSLSHLNGAAPTLKNLDLLERKEFSKRGVDQVNAAIKETSHQNAGKSLTIYGVPVDDQPETDVLSNYMTTTTPKRVKVEKDTSNHSELRPATYSPTVGHSAKYASRTNAGTVVFSYGDEDVKPVDINNVLNLNVTQVPNDDNDTYSKAMFGFELLYEKATVYDNHIRYISQSILKKLGITETCSVRHKSQTEVTVAGRIECDADARLNPKSVVLQGTWDESLSQAVPVDLDNVQQYALFPGQVAVLRGVNPRGDRFQAREVLCDAALPLADHRKDLTNTFIGLMSMIVVAGPYTTSDNLSYEPLKDLVTYIGIHKPHIVIMTGPFMDSEHVKVKDNTLAETYKSFFEKLLDSLGEISNTSPHTKICIVSNQSDAFHVNIYPTPPYTTRKKHPNIQFLPDPCTLNINGIYVGVTSTDVLMQISKEEISLGTGGDKLARLAGHVIGQQSYSPLWPPPGAPVDAALWAAHAQLPRTPHVLVLPSNFRYFVKEVSGCVVVNPERLAKGAVGGTFARLTLNVTDKTEHVCKSISAQIIRI